MNIPRHAYEGGGKYGAESQLGLAVSAAAQIPGNITDIDYDWEQAFHESFGPGNENLQAQTPTSYRYPVRLDFEPLDGGGGSFLAAYCQRSVVDGSLPSLTMEFSTSRIDSLSDILAGCVCNRLRLSAAQKGILTASTEWIAMHASLGAGITWSKPTNRPYAWAKSTWYDGEQAADIYPVSIDLNLEHNLNEVYAAFTSLMGSAVDYEASHLFPGYTNVRADIRALSKIALTDVDNITVVSTFLGSTSTLQITMENGAYRGARRRIPSNDLIEFGIPMTFRTVTITET